MIVSVYDKLVAYGILPPFTNASILSAFERWGTLSLVLCCDVGLAHCLPRLVCEAREINDSLISAFMFSTRLPRWHHYPRAAAYDARVVVPCYPKCITPRRSTPLTIQVRPYIDDTSSFRRRGMDATQCRV